jgi:hypothetical protein
MPDCPCNGGGLNDVLYFPSRCSWIGSEVLFDAPEGSVSGRVGSALVEGQAQLPCLFDAISDYSITGPQVDLEPFIKSSSRFSTVIISNRIILVDLNDIREYYSSVGI